MLNGLDRRIQGLVGNQSAKWRLSLYETAGEAGGCFMATSRGSDRGVRGAAVDPDRARAEAARRARGKLRRYCAANGLSRLGTLTYGGSGCHDQGQIRADLAEFWRALRGSLGGAALPYVWVPEWHKSGHGLHAHFAVGKFIPRQKIAEAWGRGFVHIKRLTDLPVGSNTRAESRRAAAYLSKYVSKTFDSSSELLHRFDVAQGFQPPVTRLESCSREDLIAEAGERMHAQPAVEWTSQSVTEWKGPPAVWLAWD